METCGREESDKIEKPLFREAEISLGAQTLVREVERQEVSGLTRTATS